MQWCCSMPFASGASHPVPEQHKAAGRQQLLLPLWLAEVEAFSMMSLFFLSSPAGVPCFFQHKKMLWDMRWTWGKLIIWFVFLCCACASIHLYWLILNNIPAKGRKMLNFHAEQNKDSLQLNSAFYATKLYLWTSLLYFLTSTDFGEIQSCSWAIWSHWWGKIKWMHLYISKCLH